MSLQSAERARMRLRDLLAVPFVVIRVPLNGIDRQLIRRFDRRCGVRVVFDCSLGTVDILAGHLLGDDSITRYGVGRVRTALHPDGPARVPLHST